ncbi:MAG: hypothetical protein EXR69_05640 [Myxococcales bacterium]|nr:hypothetical protein [Myxococcales bacterium]
MAAWIPALRFMMAMQRRPAEDVDGIGRETTIAGTPGLVFPARGVPRGQVLVVHGVTPRGLRDPRMVHLSASLAAAGFDVVAPEFIGLQRADLRPVTVEQIRRYAAALGPEVRLLAPSFAGGLCLRAVADGAQVRSVCSIGGYGHVRDSLGRLLTPEVDAYPRVAVCLNLGVFDEAEADALRGWMWDDSVRATERRFPAARAALTAGQGCRVDGVVAGTWHELPTWFLHLPDEVDQLDVSSVADRIRVPVVLIHGSEDRVIPPSESVALGRLLPNATVCVTPLLTHGDAVPAWKKPGAIRAMGSAFARFLE